MALDDTMAKYKMTLRSDATLPTYTPEPGPPIDPEDQLVRDATRDPVEFGHSISGTISATLLPSVYGMLQSSFCVLDSEIRRLARQAKFSGLDKHATVQFEKYASALVKLVAMQHTVRDNNQLEALPDSTLLEHAEAVLAKRKSPKPKKVKTPI